MPRMGPGTAPRTNNRFRPASTFTTLRPTSVWRSAPMWPGMRLPLITREGSVPGPTLPGLRWRVLPWVAGPPAKPWRFTTPWNPRPLVVPVTLIHSPGWKMPTVTTCPGAGGALGPGRQPELLEPHGHRLQPRLLGVSRFGLGGPLGLELAEPQLHRPAAVCRRAPPKHRTGPA